MSEKIKVEKPMSLRKFKGLPFAWLTKGSSIGRGYGIRTDGKKFWCLLADSIVERTLPGCHHTLDDAVKEATNNVMNLATQVSERMAKLMQAVTALRASIQGTTGVESPTQKSNNTKKGKHLPTVVCV